MAAERQPALRSPLRFAAEGIEGLVIAAATLITWPLSRRWLANWGSRPAERDRSWPGDELAPDAVRTFTRAITVAADAEEVWPWVVQFGLGRAGFYSYELLERLVRIPVRNVEAVMPEHQFLAVGDTIKLHPDAPGIPVADVETGRRVCFGESGPIGDTTPDPRRSWSIYIEPASPGACRVLVRTRIEALRAPSWSKRVALAVDGPMDFAMEQRMLRSIRRLVTSVEQPPPPPGRAASSAR